MQKGTGIMAKGMLSGFLARNKELFEAHGVDTSFKLPSDREEFIKQRDERLERDAINQYAMFQRQKAQVYRAYSLWPNEHEMNFEFSEWKPQLQSNPQEARAIGIKAFRLAKQLSSKSFNVFMNGQPGVGKTSLALAMMSEANKQGLSTMFVSTTILQRLFMDKYDDETIAEHLINIIRAMKEADVLVLDDFGTEGGSLTSIEKGSRVHLDLQRRMYEIANARWDEKNNQPRGHTIITTNNFEKELNKIYDPKVISRLIPKQSEYRIGFNDMEDVRGK